MAVHPRAEPTSSPGPGPARPEQVSDTAVSESNLATTICRPGYSETVRTPPERLTERPEPVGNGLARGLNADEGPAAETGPS